MTTILKSSMSRFSHLIKSEKKMKKKFKKRLEVVLIYINAIEQKMSPDLSQGDLVEWTEEDFTFATRLVITFINDVQISFIKENSKKAIDCYIQVMLINMEISRRVNQYRIRTEY